MTNGEKLKEIFPNIDSTLYSDTDLMLVKWADKNLKSFSANWWNAEYIEPNSDIRFNRVENEFNQDKNELESTTKNNLAVDCVTRQDVERYIEGFINEYTSEEELEFINLELDGLKHLPPVTPQEPILDKIYADIQRLRGCSCSCSDGIIDDVENILDKYKGESEDKE